MTTPVGLTPWDKERGQKVIDDLTKQMDESAVAAQKYGSMWGAARWLTMVVLIILSAVVAARESLKGLHLEGAMFAIFAVVVAILTAFDQVAKPGTRWRLSAGYATRFRGLKTDAQLIDPMDRAGIEKLNQKFLDLNDKWLTDTTL